MYCRNVLLTVILAMVGCGSKYAGDEAMLADPESEPAILEATSATASTPAVPRKIIYTAMIDLRVDDFARAEKDVTSMVSQSGGYIAEFREDRRYGGQLGGQWVVRIPVSEFDAFVKQVLDLGVPMMRQIDAQDVTEQFVDLTARLSNKRKLEERILKLLDDRAGAIKEVIEVETQLGRVREEIELHEGKLRYLSDRIAMTTITISAQEDKNYIPDQAPTFVAKIKNVFFGSLDAIRRFAEGVVLLLVATAPWLLIACIFLAPAVLWYRRRRRRRA